MKYIDDTSRNEAYEISFNKNKVWKAIFFLGTLFALLCLVFY